MKLPAVIRLVLSIPGFAVALEAAAPHPTTLTVQYKGAMLPVVKVVSTDPVVQVDGKEKRIRTEPIYQPQRTRDFSPESVRLKDISLGGTQYFMVYDQADDGPRPARIGNHGGVAEFQATLVADRPLEGAFIAVVLFTPAVFELDSELFRSQIVVHELPPLPAGVEVPVRITSKMFTYIPDQQYFVQVFDRNGAEIFTPYARPGWDYYARVERAQLAAVLKRYVADQAGRDAPARPVVMIKPFLPDRSQLPTGSVTAYLTVTPDGLVEDVSLSEALPGPADGAVQAALSGWLFLPRIKAGSAVSSRIEVPLQFQADAKM